MGCPHFCCYDRRRFGPAHRQLRVPMARTPRGTRQLPTRKNTHPLSHRATLQSQRWNDCVTLCTAPSVQQCAGGGNYVSANLPPGGWSMGQLHIPNDSLKSVWMSNTCKVTFYEHANFGGYAKTITP